MMSEVSTHTRVGPKSIAYLLPYNPGAGSGVWKKIEDQVTAWERMGSQVRVYMLSSASTPVPIPRFESPLETETYQGLVRRLGPLSSLVKRIREWTPQVVYYRYALNYRPIMRLARTVPLFLELNTNDKREYRHQALSLHLYNLLTRRALFCRSAGVVLISGELRLVIPACVPTEQTVVIGNSIDLSRFPDKGAANTPGSRPRLAFMCTSEREPWQALDKIMWLAQRFPTWTFDLVGLTRASLKNAPPNMQFHGRLSQPEYSSILTSADVAIGTLGLHRAGFSNGSPLKTREYLAFGLPCVLGYNDIDLPEGLEFVLQIPNTENNVRTHAVDIEDFVGRMRGIRVPRSEVLQIDTSVKERLRLAFMKETLEATQQVVRRAE